MAKIPGLTRPHWWDRDWISELWAGVLAAVMLVIAAVNEMKKQGGDSRLYWLAAGLLIGGAGWKIVRGLRRDAERMKNESPADLLGCIYVLYQLLKTELNFKDDDLRVTIHRVVRNQAPQLSYYEQITPYVGGKSSGHPGRRWSIQCGIVGKTARTGKPFLAARANNDAAAFIEELVADWGYSREDAQKLSVDREAWLAVPIFEDEASNAVIGVVFVDSTRRTLMNDRCQALVFEGCKAIAKYVGKRYK